MRTSPPTVWVSARTGISELEEGLQLDSPTWFTWLEESTTTSFAYPVYDDAHGYIDSYLMVRKERRQRGGMYWTAYQHVGGRLRTVVCLGRSRTITDARLQAIAATVFEQPQPCPFSLTERGRVDD